MDDRRETTKEALKTIDRGGKGANVGAMGWLELGLGNLSDGRRQSKRATDLLGNLRFGRRKFAERMQNFSRTYWADASFRRICWAIPQTSGRANANFRRICWTNASFRRICCKICWVNASSRRICWSIRQIWCNICWVNTSARRICWVIQGLPSHGESSPRRDCYFTTHLLGDLLELSV